MTFKNNKIHMKTNKKYLLFLFLSTFLLSFSCKKKETEEGSTSSFSKTELLSNLGDNIILPGYNSLKLNIEDFESKHNSFINAKTEENFDSLKASWKRTYIQWNKVSIFNFGPAMDYGLQAAIGTFPTDTSKMLDNISSGSYNLSTSSNIDAIGIPAFDFLLYRSASFEDYSNDANYSDYALALIQKMKSEVTTVYNLWNTSYLVTFKTSTGTESTSAFSIFINSFVKSYEEAKWTKLGIPLGKQSLNCSLQT
jgi:predicted lipoprotein